VTLSNDQKKHDKRLWLAQATQSKLNSVSRYLLSAVVLLFIASVAPKVYCAAASWKPVKPVELIVAVSAGSAHDKTARIIQNILQEQKIVATPIIVVNKPGGGQTLAMTYLQRSGEDGHSLLLAAVPQMTSKITGKTTLAYNDFTPITQLFNEYVAFAVRKESPLITGADMVSRLKSDPRALSIAIGSAVGNGPHLALSLAMRQGGVRIRELKTVIFQGGTEATLAVLGGHVDVLATTTGNVLPFVARGEMRVIAVSSPKRLSGAYAQIPTWREQGLNSVFSSFRFVLGTRAMDPAQVAYWEQVFVKLSQTSEWKQYLESNNLEVATLGSKESETFLREEYARLQVVMTELGLTK
jgi:putative tricarboxylic transport membrane protein